MTTSLEKGESSRSMKRKGSQAQIFTVSNLFKAAQVGDVEFLKEALNTQPTEYLLSKRKEEGNCNIIHIASTRLLGDIHELKVNKLNLLTFIEVALENLPAQASLSLLCAKEEMHEHTPLHYAALRGCLPAVRLLVDFYKKTRYPIESEVVGLESLDSCCLQPWLAKNKFGDTPLHTTLKESSRKRGEACASYLLSLDMECLCNSVNMLGHTPLSLAMKVGFNHVAQVILESECRYSLFGPDGFSLLHLVASSSVKVFKLLVRKHPELVRDNNNIAACSVLHKWAEVRKLWPLELLLKLKKNSVMEMIRSVDHRGDTPLHAAWLNHNIFFAERLLDSYKQAIREEPFNLANCSLWAMQNIDGNTPLHSALTNEHIDEKVLLKIMSEDPSVLHICNNAGESPLFVAVYKGHEEVVRRILDLPDSELVEGGRETERCLTSNDSMMFVLTEEVGLVMVEKFWWLINSTDANGKTALQVAEQAEILWAKKLLSRWTNVPYAIKRPNSDWIKASRRGHSKALIAFISHYPDFLRTCSERKDTPLHHIELNSIKEYQNFLMNPIIAKMKNMRDHDNATPLHRSLERKDMLLVETLLTTEGVETSLRNKNGKTASDMLAELCAQHHEWREMCLRIQVNPWLKPTYVQPTKTNLAEMRQTLSVVAALLATLTFAAGFTVPGGFNNDNGEAIMARKAAFLVFILADTIAMCCSMLALFCLIWSMVSDVPDKSVILIDQSMVILMLALYGTLLAFMTGVFTVISQLSLWAAIVVCIICSLVGIAANKTLLSKVLNKLLPAANQEPRDPLRLLEQGKAFLCTGGDSQSQKAE